MITHNLGPRLNQVLNDKSISKADFARSLGVKPQQVNKWIKMDQFRWDQICEFSKTVGMTPQEFLEM